MIIIMIVISHYIFAGKKNQCNSCKTLACNELFHEMHNKKRNSHAPDLMCTLNTK